MLSFASSSIHIQGQMQINALQKACTPYHSAYWVIDEKVFQLYLSEIDFWQKNIKIPHHNYLMIAKEENKTLFQVEKIWEFLIENRANRSSVLICLGGGVCSDIVGFAASCYMRGIDWMVIPTSLTAMVDASIGGKTGVNIQKTKNVVGQICLPSHIFICSSFLCTLSQSLISQGFAEIIKYAILSKTALFSFLESVDFSSLFSEKDLFLWEEILFESVQIKQNLIEQDLKDQTGIRATLNLGHTFAHAIESASSYAISHGDAVAIGLNLCSLLSYELNLIPQNLVDKIQNLLKKFQLPLYPNHFISPEKIWSFMQNDKKNKGDKIRWIVFDQIGHAFLKDDINELLVKKILANLNTK